MADKLEIPSEDLLLRPPGSFGKWRILSYSGKQRHESPSGATNVSDIWVCECQCQHKTRQTITKGNLVGGRSTQCLRCASKKKSKGIRPHLKMWYRYRRGMCEAWQDERVFGGFYAQRTASYLQRHDQTQPLSPENCYWSRLTKRAISFQEKIAGHRMALLGETHEQAMAWCQSVSRQRLHQWLDAYGGDETRRAVHEKSVIRSNGYRRTARAAGT